MCGVDLYWSHICNLVYGASDEKRGFSYINRKLIHPKTEVSAGLMAAESGELVKRFFQKLRD